MEATADFDDDLTIVVLRYADRRCQPGWGGRAAHPLTTTARYTGTAPASTERSRPAFFAE
ncbi:hypothetical protein Ari01nite_68420 [Paractinoplanes rishiriensis]|uniref:Uncharacterized protein n=1 Tax=Paractinoplanes rishiriensis TaxID=1050105 RepID=A0A919K4X4_9ACTN|nr:hypothetical protein Ari01nite_68420 [Actinoplanes rishiriensis]